MKGKKTFLVNTVILTATALLLRAVGLFFRVYLSNIIGADGMGLYQLILSVYMLASTYATSGISTAVTRLCADEMACGSKQAVLKVLKRSVQLSVLVGGLLNLAVFCFSGGIASIFIGDIRAARSLKILSFSLVPMGISACFKGYFMARRKTITPGVASIIEQTVRIAVIMLMLGSMQAKNIETACFYVLLADTVAETVSCIFVFLSCIKDKKSLQITPKKSRHKKGVTKALLKIATPITAGKYLTSLLHTAENLMMPKCLTAFSGNSASSLETFGLLKGMALPIIFFPSSFLLSVSTLLIPEISESVALGQKDVIRHDVSKTISITVFGSVLAGGCFFVCSNAIGNALYSSAEVGVLLNVLSPLVPVMYLEAVVDGILKGLDKQTSTFLYNTVDAIIRILLMVLLVPRFGMNGFLIMMAFSNLFTCSLNFIKLLKTTVLRFDIKNWVVKPLLSITLACTFTKLFCVNITNDIALIIIAVSLITAIYFLTYAIMNIKSRKIG